MPRLAPPLAAASLAATLVSLAGAEPAGTVLWRVPLPDFTPTHPATIAPNGNVYFYSRDLIALTPEGIERWRVTPPGLANNGPVAIDESENVYVSTPRNVVSYSSTGDHRWTFSDVGPGVLAGPGIGPDGGLYQINGHSAGGLGAFELDPADGSLRWSLPDPGFTDQGYPGHVLAFNDEAMFFALENRGVRRAAMDAISLDGDYDWGAFTNADTDPRVAPGGDIVISQNNAVFRYRPDGSTRFGVGIGGNPTPPAIDGDGNAYVFTFGRFLTKYDPDGDIVLEETYSGWATPGDSSSRIGPRIAPGRDVMVLSANGADRAPGTIRGIDIDTGAELWATELPVVPGPDYDYLSAGYAYAAFSPDGTVAYIPVANFVQSWLYAIQVVDVEEVDERHAADFNNDGAVNAADLAALIAAWGGSGPADLNADGVVDAADLAAVIAAWGV